MNCTTAATQLTAFTRGDLDVDLQEPLAEHLRACEACRLELGSEREFHDLVERLMPRTRPEFLKGVMFAIREQILLGDGLSGLRAGIEGARHEINEVLSEQVENVRELGLALRRRVWAISLSVAAHAAVLLVCALLVFSDRDQRQLEHIVAIAVVEVRNDTLANDSDGSSIGAAPSQTTAHLSLRGAPEGELDETAALPTGTPDSPDAGSGQTSGSATAGSGAELTVAEERELWMRLDVAPGKSPARLAAHPELLTQRTDEKARTRTLAHYAGMETVGSAIDAGLAYLARQQREDGSWDPEIGGGQKDLEIAVTGLGLLPFLAEGFNSSSDNLYGRAVVRRGIACLEAAQSPDGGIGATVGERGMFNHALATLALCENLALLGPHARSGVSERALAYRAHARAAMRAIRFLQATQIQPTGNDASSRSRSAQVAGGWDYKPHARATDSNVSGWCVQALATYELALGTSQRYGVIRLQNSYRGIAHWIESYTDPLTGQVGYDGFRQYGRYGPVTMTAIGLLSDLLTGESSSRALRQTQARLVASEPLTFGGRLGPDPDYTRGYFGMLALYLHDPQSEGFRRAYHRAVDELLGLQVNVAETRTSAGGDLGSWEPLCRWSPYGGRAYTTSMALLVLQTPYRLVK